MTDYDARAQREHFTADGTCAGDHCVEHSVEIDATRDRLARVIECVIGIGVDPFPDCALCARTLPCPIHVGQAAADAILAEFRVSPPETTDPESRT